MVKQAVKFYAKAFDVKHEDDWRLLKECAYFSIGEQNNFWEFFFNVVLLKHYRTGIYFQQ